jgi:uncharacterized damage-inducible protein DinB
MKNHCLKLAGYHRWAYETLLKRLEALTPAELTKDVGLFFHNIMGTLNHLLIIDDLWIARLEGAQWAFSSLDQTVETEFSPLGQRLLATSERLRAVVLKQPVDAFETCLNLRNSEGDTLPFSFSDVVVHTVNHSTHHRGQISSALTIFGQETPKMDMYYYFLRDHPA